MSNLLQINMDGRLNITDKNIGDVENFVSEILKKIQNELLNKDLKKDEKLFLSSNYTTLLNFQKIYKNQMQHIFNR